MGSRCPEPESFEEQADLNTGSRETECSVAERLTYYLAKATDGGIERTVSTVCFACRQGFSACRVLNLLSWFSTFLLPPSPPKQQQQQNNI